MLQGMVLPGQWQTAPVREMQESVLGPGARKREKEASARVGVRGKPNVKNPKHPPAFCCAFERFCEAFSATGIHSPSRIAHPKQPAGDLEGVGLCRNLVIFQRLAWVENLSCDTFAVPWWLLFGSGLDSRSEVEA